MATTTSVLGLTKPAGDEAYDVDVSNENFQKIDNYAGTVNTNLTKLNTQTGYVNNQNPDNYTTTGSYHIGTDSSHSPTGSVIYGILVVFSAHDTISQTFVQTDGTIFTRVKPNANSSWLSWKKRNDLVTKEAELTFTSGQTRSAIDVTFTGASSYHWTAMQKPTSNENAYASVFIEYVYASGANNIIAGVNRQLRSSTSDSITVKLLFIGIRI